MNNKNARRRIVTVLASVLAMAAASCAPATSDEVENDPLETVNRGIFAFNNVADDFVIEPVAKGYRYVTPDAVRSRIGNASDNLNEPLNMVNSFLQGNFTQGVTSFWRFVLNSTVGIAGLNDVASTAGLKHQPEDFGQTLAVWGAGEGPYIVLPIIGPSNVRDTAGMATDWFLLNPVNYAVDDTSTEIWIALAQGLVERERLIDVLDDVEESSLDEYATLRSMYRQHRAAKIKNQGDGPLPTTSPEGND